MPWRKPQFCKTSSENRSLLPFVCYKLWNQKGSKKNNIWLCLHHVVSGLTGLNTRRHLVLWEGTWLPTLSTSSVPCLLLAQVWCWEPREALAQISASVEHYSDVTCISPQQLISDIPPNHGEHCRVLENKRYSMISAVFQRIRYFKNNI